MSAMQKIKHTPLDETADLIILAKTGNKDAMERLIQRNEGIIRKVMTKFFARRFIFGVEYEDLLQIGYLNFIIAIKKFELSGKISFITYIRNSLNFAMFNWIRDNGYLLQSSNADREVITKLCRLSEKFEEKHGRLPSEKELAEIHGVTVKEITTYYSYKDPLSLNRRVEVSGSTSELQELQDLLRTPEFPHEVGIDLHDAMTSLNDRMFTLVFEHYYLDREVKDIAKDLGISIQLAYRNMKQALEIIKKKLVGRSNFYYLIN